MKIFVFTVLLLAVLIQRISARNIESDIEAIVRTCEREENVSRSFNDTWTPGQVTELRSNKCFLKCMLVKNGLCNDKGEVSVDGYMTLLRNRAKSQSPPPWNLEEMIQNCASASTVVEPCEKVYQFTLCVQEKVDLAKKEMKL